FRQVRHLFTSAMICAQAEARRQACRPRESRRSAGCYSADSRRQTRRANVQDTARQSLFSDVQGVVERLRRPAHGVTLDVQAQPFQSLDLAPHEGVTYPGVLIGEVRDLHDASRSSRAVRTHVRSWPRRAARTYIGNLDSM